MTDLNDLEALEALRALHWKLPERASCSCGDLASECQEYAILDRLAPTPSTVTSVEELKKLPDRTVVLDAHGESSQTIDGQWFHAVNSHDPHPASVALPATILHEHPPVAASEVEIQREDAGPNAGHTFEVSVSSRGSSNVVGDPEHHDSNWWGEPFVTRVRAWNQADALRMAVQMPLHEWDRAPEPDAETVEITEAQVDVALSHRYAENLFRCSCGKPCVNHRAFVHHVLRAALTQGREK